MNRRTCINLACIILAARAVTAAEPEPLESLLAASRQGQLTQPELERLRAALKEPSLAGHWPAAAGVLRARLGEAEAARVAEAVWNRWGRDNQTLGGLDASQAVALRSALTALGAAETSGHVPARWVDARPDAARSDPRALWPIVASVAEDASADAKAVRPRLARALLAAYLDSSDPPASADRVQRLRLAGRMAGDLPADQKRRLIDAITKDYRQREEVLSSLTLNGAKTLYEACARAGRPDAGAEAVCDWLAASDAWRSEQTDPVAVAMMDHIFAAYTGDSPKVRRQQAALVERLWTYLGSDAAMARLPADRMLKVAFHAIRLLPAERKPDLGERISTYLLARPAALKALTTEQVLDARVTLVRLAGVRPASAVVGTWVELTDRWRDAPAEELETFIDDVNRSDAPEGLGPERATALAEGFALAFQKSPPGDLKGLFLLANFMKRARLTGRGKGSASYAKALALAIRRGATLNDWQLADGVLACPLRNPETRKILQQELTDADGLVRPAAARILAWSYEWDKLLPTWRALVDGKLAEKGLSADARATWLAAKGYAEAIAPEVVQPARQIPWLERAVASAKSENVRLAMTEELARAYYTVGRKDVAVSMLAGAAAQFTPDGRARVVELQGRIRSDHLAEQKRAADDQARARAALKHSRLAYYQRRLSAARRAGDLKAAKDLETAISQLQAELGK